MGLIAQAIRKTAEEQEFLKWYRKWADELGLSSDPDDPKHFYDYREAWKAGVGPTWQPEHGQYRWPDKFKKKGYPYK